MAPYIEKGGISDIDTSVSSDSSFSAVPAVAHAVPAVAQSQSSPVVTTQATRELLSQGEITQIFTKARNRRNFAALLVKHLFDEPTRMKCNVAGRGKDKLDPEVMKYIKAKAFQYFECNESEVKTEWARCITSIDDKSRALKRKFKTEKQDLEL